MTDATDEEAIELTGELAGVGVAGVVTILATSPFLIAAAAFLPTLGPVALKALVRRYGSFWDGVKGCADGSEEAARAHFNAGTDNVTAQDAVLETLRRVQDALDPDVLFALGRLLWPYADGKRKPNRFFRSMGNMLTDIDSDELMLLRDLLRAVVRQGDSFVRLQSDVTESHDPVRRGIGLVGTGTVILEGVFGNSLFPLLKRHGFANGVGGFGMDAETSAELHLFTVEAILEVIDVEFVPTPRSE